MKRIMQILNVFVFIAATLAIMGVVYEGFSLKWFSVVGAFIITMDFLFILSTIMNLIFCRNNKTIFIFSIISLIMIATALVMKGMKIEYSVITLILWYFYIWFYYGIQLSKKLWIKVD